MKEEMRLMVVKMSSRHRAAIQQIASADKEPVAVVVRQLIRQEAQRRGLWGGDGQAQETPAYIGQ